MGGRIPPAFAAIFGNIGQVAQFHQLAGDGVCRTIDASNGINTSQLNTPPATSTPAILGPMIYPTPMYSGVISPTDLGRWKEFIGLFGDPVRGFRDHMQYFLKNGIHTKPHPGPKGRAGKIAALFTGLKHITASRNLPG